MTATAKKGEFPGDTAESRVPTLEEAIATRSAGDARAAADICRAVIKHHPADTAALQFLAELMMEGRLYSQACEFLARAISIRNGDPDLLFNYGVALRGTHNYLAAVKAFERATRYRPEFVEAWYNLGNTYISRGQFAEAVAAFDAAIGVDPNDERFHNNAGIALRQLERFDEAASRFRQAISLDPDNAGFHNNLGNVLVCLKRFDEAIEAFGEAIHLAPDYAEAIYNMGSAYQQQSAFTAAASCYRTALGIDPSNQDARFNLSLALHRLGRFNEAADMLDALDAETAGAPRALARRAGIRADQGRFEEAFALFDRALASGDDATILSDRGIVYLHAGQPDKALDDYLRAVDLAPDNEPIASAFAQTLLATGNHKDGWRTFERRLEDSDFAARMASLPGTGWSGEALSGKSILVECEQGFGDTLQFVRYLPELAARDAHVVLCCPARLVPLLASVPGANDVVSRDHRPMTDVHVPLLSLPFHLERFAPDGSMVPYLAADPDRIEVWRRRLGGGVKIGVAWQGNPAYDRDYARSLKPDRLAPLASLTGSDGLRFISLQQTGSAELPDWIEETETPLDEDGAFLDTAAIMANLDLILTTDTAIPHLAGAMGRPVWMLTGSAPDWRWWGEDHRSDWYPSLRLVRQSSPTDWETPIRKARDVLTGWYEAGGDPLAFFDRSI